MIGQTLAHYEILGKLGKGGMGEVYRALDRKLDRQVALKILPADLAGDRHFIERFEREAKTVAALNHPNIVTIHSVEEADGVHFLTMELVEGVGLDRHLPKSGLALDRFFELALPLTEAVAAAHEAGVTHRDLKPANVMVAAKGRLKVLDFGLAKLIEATDDTLEADARTEALTREGLVVGTIPYMSPEQVQGDAVDSRSDIFSLGIMLYEMLTGRRPFAGRNSAEVISALLRDTPTPVDELAEAVPDHLARVVRRCLEKDPDRRYQSARDLVIELEDLQRETGGGTTSVAPESGSGRWLRALRGAGLVIVLIVVAALIREWATGWSVSDEPAALAPLRLTKLTGGAGLEDEPAWSPDGRFIAYVTNERGNLDIVVQPLGGGERIWAFAGDADEASPAWSPDGERLAFVSARDRDGVLAPGVGLGALTSYVVASGGDLFVAPALGGTALKLAENAYVPAWSPDGRRIAYTSADDKDYAIWTVDAGGGTPVKVSAAGTAFDPAWSPDGERLVYGLIDAVSGRYELHVISSDGSGSPAVLELPNNAYLLSPAWSADGDHVYFASDLAGRVNVWRVRAPARGARTLGEPSQVTFGSGADVSIGVEPTSGRLAFATVTTDVNIWELDVESGATRQVTNETGWETNVQMSPDGATLLIATDRAGDPEIWAYDTSGEPLQRVGRTASVDFTGIWSPDGRRIAYSRGSHDGLEGVFLKEPGSMSETLLIDDAFAGEWSPDGDHIAAARLREGNNRYTDVVVISVADGSVRRLTFFDTHNQFMTWSPDGSELIFNSEQGGARKLWRVAFAGGEPEQLTFGESEDSHPRWSRTDPRAVVYLRNHSTICVLDPSSGEIEELEVDVGPHSGLDYPSWSTDGSKIYFSAATKSGDIFVTEE